MRRFELRAWVGTIAVLRELNDRRIPSSTEYGVSSYREEVWYGARNPVIAESSCSGASSATQCPLPGMMTLWTSSATSFIVLAVPSPMPLAPPIAKTGKVSRLVLRCAFCAVVMSIAR